MRHTLPLYSIFEIQWSNGETQSNAAEAKLILIKWIHLPLNYAPNILIEKFDLHFWVENFSGKQREWERKRKRDEDEDNEWQGRRCSSYVCANAMHKRAHEHQWMTGWQLIVPFTRHIFSYFLYFVCRTHKFAFNLLNCGAMRFSVVAHHQLHKCSMAISQSCCLLYMPFLFSSYQPTTASPLPPSCNMPSAIADASSFYS